MWAKEQSMPCLNLSEDNAYCVVIIVGQRPNIHLVKVSGVSGVYFI